MNQGNIFNLIYHKFFRKINKDYITFTSFNGKYADSPRVISEQIHRIDKTKKIIWLLNDTNNKEIPEYITKVQYGSKEARKYFSKSKVIIDNVYCMHETYLEKKGMLSKIKFLLATFLKTKKHARYYTFWHGTPIKRIGADSVKSHVLDFSCPNTTMIIDSQYLKDIQKRITFGKLQYKVLGAPRNDILFQNNIDKTQLKKKLDLPNKKIVLYAPSFRSDKDEKDDIARSGLNQIEQLDIEQLLKTLSDTFGDEWIFVGRFHYKVEKYINWEKLNKKYNNKIYNGNKHEDIVDYLQCCDALITDISSCLFDALLIHLPVFSFCPDIDQFSKTERGLYIDKNGFPLTIAETSDELIDSIKKYDEKTYRKETDIFLDQLGFTPAKSTGEKIARMILEESKNK